ncbi:hypothetical protein AYI68_g4260 [Smittium mucronatum]|uniref:Succinylglutamate desuccinylase/Aspartoacylase catalytic domain-containing protein n=1 Tax=Smittium mucronatum TaxID=133383 RepID=A0A1R0GXK6_9FUNG|nr:hypothetical protein AYI68_g4693 [Smittium mucronatum]OLY81631.1 hypothetical protein AYI68_g4260 [Smittium mucronatum]
MTKLIKLLSAFASFFLRFSHGNTVYTGDILNGHKVITRLSVDDFPCGEVTKLWLRANNNKIGQAYHVPLLVARGSNCNCDENRFVMNTGLHGDELNGIRVIHRVMKDLDLNLLNGTVVGVPGSNVNGLYEETRGYFNSYDSGSFTNLNRQFPGDITNSSSAGEIFATMLWDAIYNDNGYTAGVDFHTQSTSGSFVNFVYADLTIPYVRNMCDLTGADVIKIDLGDGTLGALENVWDAFGVPAITYELGSPLSWQKDQIQRGYDYVFRQLADIHMYPPPTDPIAIAEYKKNYPNIYYGTETGGASVPTGGFLQTFVKLNEDVTTKTKIASLYNVFGDLITDFYPEFDGRLYSLSTHPLREVGAGTFGVIHNSTDPACRNGC